MNPLQIKVMTLTGGVKDIYHFVYLFKTKKKSGTITVFAEFISDGVDEL